MTLDTILQGDCLEVLKTLPDNSINCCVTSPPYYGLRDYGTGEWVGGNPDCPHRRMSKFSESTITGHFQEELRGNVGDAIYKQICPLCGARREDKQIGLEETPEEYVDKLVQVFREVKRVLKDDGTLWLNIGDSYSGSGHGMNADGSITITDKQLIQQGNKASYMSTPQKKLSGYKPKDLIGIPWLLAFALRNDGWYLRQDIIWHKPNPMPESVKDRCTKSHEYIFLLSKKPHYYFDYEAIQEEAKWASDKRALQGRIEYDGKRTDGGVEHTKAQKSFVSFQVKHNNLQDNGQHNHSMHERRAEGLPDETYVVRNKRDVWSVTTKAVKEAHFATFPEKLIEPCILAGCPSGGIVLDPFFGSGTTGRVATRLNRHYVGVELNPEYIEIANKRTNNVQLSLIGM